MSSILRVRLEGQDAELGRVGAGDFARLILGVERAVARAAGHVIGRQVKPTGRRGRTIEETTRFRLLGIEQGSVIGVLELPAVEAEEETLDVDVPTLGDLAIEGALATAAGDVTDYVDVAGAFVDLADRLGIGARYDAITFDAATSPRPTVRVDRAVRDRLQAAITERGQQRDESLTGVLVEADFENYSAHLRTAGGQRISVRFEPSLADDIQEGLRRQRELVGEVQYDATTMEARSVKLREIVRQEQLSITLEPGEFWASHDIEALAVEQGVAAVSDVAMLRDPDPADDEVDRFLAALKEM